MENIVDYAVEYAKQDMAIIPLLPDKRPRFSGWQEKASKDPAIIRAWWAKWPDSPIGIVTGQSSMGGLYVIDMDVDDLKGKDGYHSMRDWERTYGELPDSWRAITGRGGNHYYFHSANDHIENRIGILEDVDVRGDGGFVVAPPSIHPNGRPYEWEQNWEDGIIIAEKNDIIAFFLQTGKENHNKFVAPDIIPEGERNGILFKLGCSMQAKGLSDQAIYAAVSAENSNKCNPPLSDDEICKIVESVTKYEKGKPIYVSNNLTVTQGQREPKFKYTENGRIDQSWDNIREAIEYDEFLYGHIRYNELACSPWVYGELPWEKVDTYRPWKDSDDNSLKAYLEKKYGFRNGGKILEALTIVLNINSFNPIKEELEQIYQEYKDECAGSIRKLLPEYMGTEDNEYNFEVMKLYMLGAISRAFHPGCKFDYTIILYGAQGFGKSEFIRHLAIAPEWFNDNFNTFEGDKASEKLAGMWMVELAELKALKSAKDSESIKAFLTSRYDTYRAPYSRRAVQRPRMCVFAGTTNNRNVFVDKTGNRRFLPIITRKGKETKDLFGDKEMVDSDFKKAWAEAMSIFHGTDDMPELILPKVAQQDAEEMQQEFSEEDYRVGVIQNWLDNTGATKICVPLIIEYALESEPSKTTKAHQREILEILDNEIVGWSRLKNKDKGRTSFTRYGKQVCFIRDFE